MNLLYLLACSVSISCLFVCLFDIASLLSIRLFAVFIACA